MREHGLAQCIPCPWQAKVPGQRSECTKGSSCVPTQAPCYGTKLSASTWGSRPIALKGGPRRYTCPGGGWASSSSRCSPLPARWGARSSSWEFLSHGPYLSPGGRVHSPARRLSYFAFLSYLSTYSPLPSWPVVFAPPPALAPWHANARAEGADGRSPDKGQTKQGPFVPR
ncbi:unnamed protein product [Eretmochelys imbricata]